MAGNQQLVDGPALGAVLAEAGVPVLVLNACRSAHADLVAEPETVTEELDAQQRIRAYGSLAQEVMEAGVAGVVAMRYNVWVNTAAQFIGQVYAGLLAGQELGSAVSAARRHLAAHPMRRVGGQPRPLQDWPAPAGIHDRVAPRAGRRRARPSAGKLDPVQHAKIRNLGQAIHALGDMKREQKDPGCVPPYLEAMKLFQRIGGRREESMSAYNLGRAYEEVPGIRDLDEAERWYSRDRALMADDDIRGHIGLQIQLGNLASRRLEESRNAGGPPGQQTRHANAAIAAYRQALTLIPADDIEARGTTYNQLGLVYRSVGQLDLSFEYLQKAVQCLVDSSNRYGAGAARCNAAKSLLLSGRFAEALLFYRAGLRDFESIGVGASAETAETRQLVKMLEGTLAQMKGNAP